MGSFEPPAHTVLLYNPLINIIMQRSVLFNVTVERVAPKCSQAAPLRLIAAGN